MEDLLIKTARPSSAGDEEYRQGLIHGLLGCNPKGGLVLFYRLNSDNLTAGCVWMLWRFMFRETNPAGLAINAIHFFLEVSALRRCEVSSYMILGGYKLPP